MLVLSRRHGEEIQIADDITVRVVHISGSRVRLAITAPDDVQIRRGELCEKSAVVEPLQQRTRSGDSVSMLRKRATA